MRRSRRAARSSAALRHSGSRGRPSGRSSSRAKSIARVGRCASPARLASRACSRRRGDRRTVPRMKSLPLIVAAVVALAGCKKHEDAPKVDPTGSAAVRAPAADAAIDTAIDAGLTDEQKLAKGMAEADADAAKEAARWTPDLAKAVVTVRDQKAKDTATALAAILASPHRMPG